ncbi:MAG: hypothetical protein ACI392_00010 [Paludibacteraceae bacterium]
MADLFYRRWRIDGRFVKNSMSSFFCSSIIFYNFVIATITKEYATQIEKLQDARDAAVKQSVSLLKQNSDLTKQNSILSSAATAPHINVNNNG